MSNEQSKHLGNWGLMTPSPTPASPKAHITQTNANAKVGEGAHVTTPIPGTGVIARDYFNPQGEHVRTEYTSKD